MNKLRIHADDIRISAEWRLAAACVGIQCSYTEGVWFPLQDTTAAKIAESTGYTAFFDVTDRISQQSLGIPVIPSVVAKQEQDLHAFGDVPLFVKPARTYGKDTSYAFAYSAWESPAQLAAAVDAVFWERQEGPRALTMVVQPAVPLPFLTIFCCIAINEAHEVLVLHNNTMLVIDPHNYENMMGHIPLPESVDAQIRAVCKQKQLRAGVHEVEFAATANGWLLMDWNCRPAVSTSFGRTRLSQLRERGVAHMLGATVPATPDYFTAQRRYPKGQLSASDKARAARLGMFVNSPGWRDDYLAVEAASSAEVEAVYAIFNEGLK